jgi:uncharacterized integral membrane protein
MRMLRRLLVVVVFVALFVGVWRFVGGNAQPVLIDLLFMPLSVPLWLALVGAFLLGALCAGASLVYELAKKSLTARRYRKQMAGLESEIHQLRNLPLAASEAPLAAPEARGGAAPPRVGLADDVVRQRG